MAGRERMRLTDRAIARLRPREREYTVWDNHVAGLGVRVRPSGGRSYILLKNAGGRSRRVSLGPVSLKTVAEVRRECHARKAEPEVAGAPRRAAPLFRDFVEDAWKEPISMDTSRPRKWPSSRCSTASSCPPSARSRSTASPRPSV